MLQYFETTTRPNTTVLQRHGQSCKATKASLFAKTAYNWITSYLWEGSCMHLFVLMFVHAHVPCLDFRDSESQLKTYHGKMGNDSVFAKSWMPRCISCTVCNVVDLGIVSRLEKKVGLKKSKIWILIILEISGIDACLCWSTWRWSKPWRFPRSNPIQTLITLSEESTTRGKNHPDGIHQGRKRLLRLKIKTSINRKVATICYSPNCHNSSIVPRFNDGLHGSCR